MRDGAVYFGRTGPDFPGRRTGFAAAVRYGGAAGQLSGEERERALCSNACLLARALERSEDHVPLFSSGEEVLAGLTVEEIAALSARWRCFSRESDPGLDLSQEELEKVKKNSAATPENGCAGG